jgi:hypothetical protein
MADGEGEAEVTEPLPLLRLGRPPRSRGTAVLVYANRLECSTNPIANGCGYGTKVIGGAVLSGGIVGLVVGAATWR